MRKTILIYFLPFIIISTAGVFLGTRENKISTHEVVQKMSDGLVGMRAGRGIIQMNEIQIQSSQGKDIKCYIQTNTELPIGNFIECKNNTLCISEFSEKHVSRIIDLSNSFKNRDCKIN